VNLGFKLPLGGKCLNFKCEYILLHPIPIYSDGNLEVFVLDIFYTSTARSKTVGPFARLRGYPSGNGIALCEEFGLVTV